MTQSIEPTNPVAPIVRSTASPSAPLLLQVRGIISKDKDLQNLFLQFREEKKSVEWLRSVLPIHLSPWIDSFSFEDLKEACRYIADEYSQLPEGYLLVNTETGKVDAILSDTDLEDPGLLPRESGAMAQALKRIRPDKQVALILHSYEKGREEKVRAILADRRPVTDLLKAEGDPRARIATRTGRKEIAQTLAGIDPVDVLSRASGTAGMFLRHFPLVEGDTPEGDYHMIEGVAVSHTRIGVQDDLSWTADFDVASNLKAVAPQAWVRSIVAELVKKAYDRSILPPIDVEDLTPDLLEGVDLWIAGPDMYREILRVKATAPVLPILGASPIGLTGRVGYISLEGPPDVQSVELFRRWELKVSLPFKLYVNSKWEGLHTLPLVGGSLEGEVV